MNAVSREILERRWATRFDLLFASPVTGKETGSVRHAMLRACARAKIPPLTIRDLRRTCATRMLEAGADVVSVARQLGHTDLRMLSRYARSTDLVQKAVDNLVEDRENRLKVVK